MRCGNRRISSHRFVVIGLLVVGIRLVDGWFICWIHRIVGRFVVRLGFVVARVVSVRCAQMIRLAGRSVVLRMIAVKTVTMTVLVVTYGSELFIIAAFMMACRSLAVETGVIVLGVVTIIRCFVCVLGACKEF